MKLTLVDRMKKAQKRMDTCDAQLSAVRQKLFRLKAEEERLKTARNNAAKSVRELAHAVAKEDWS